MFNSFVQHSPRVFTCYRLDMATYGSSVDGFTKDIQDAQTIGIDGFQIDIFGWSQSTTNQFVNNIKYAEYLFTAALNLGTGFKLYFMADCQQYGSAGQAAVAAMMTAYMYHPNYWNYQGKPVLSGWEAPIDGTAGSADYTFWSGVVSAVGAGNVYFWPGFSAWNLAYGDNPTSVSNTNTWFNPWIKAMVQGVQNWNQYLPDPIFANNLIYGSLAKSNSYPFMANVNSWFAGIRFFWEAYSGGSSLPTVNYLEGNGYEGMSNIWQDLINNSRAGFVSINTWNDYSESYVSPVSQAQLTTTTTRLSNFSSWPYGVMGLVTDNAGTDYDGGQHAGLWARTSTGPSYTAMAFKVPTTALSYTTTIKVKAGNANYFALRLQGAYPHRAEVIFLLTGSGSIATAAFVTSTFTGASASITSLGNGWYQCSLTATKDTNGELSIYVSFNSNNVTVDGTDSSATSNGWMYDATLSQGANAVSFAPWQISPDYLYSHAGFTNLYKYFISWYKTGHQPQWPDAIYVSYRKAAQAVVPSVAPGTVTPLWNNQGVNATLDDIYVTTILTAPGTLNVNTGGSITNTAVAAGLVHTRIPFTAGATQTMTVTRSAATILSITGDPIVSSLTYYYHVNPLTYYATT